MKTFIHPIQSEFRLFDQAFSKVLSSSNPLIDNVLDYIHTKRGKQLRPILVILSAAICKGVTDKTINTAVSLELLHTASLIHDDVVDNSPIRRGSKSIHEQWNNKIAILVGDYLLAQVIGLLAEIRNTSILSIVSEVGASLSSGELIQLHDGESMWIDEKQYLRVIEHKTAHLFAACCEAGAVSSGVKTKQSTALKNFGMYLGLCFQLKDDVFDYSDIEDLGKPTMNDLQDGKATLPIIISLQRAPKQEADYIKNLAESMASKSPHINLFEAEQEIRSFILKYDGIRYAYQMMERFRKKAVNALSAFPDNKYKESLISLLDYAIQRMH